MFANPKNLRRFGLYLLNNYKFGNLYTWGEYSMGTGFRVPNDSPTINTPKRVEAFTGNVKKVAMGENHTAVLTDNGELFTFGLGKFGALGHSSIADVISPRKVDFFASKNL
jgi:alpha-tubulin suppressor-like RCC1 family protein